MYDHSPRALPQFIHGRYQAAPLLQPVSSFNCYWPFVRRPLSQRARFIRGVVVEDRARGDSKIQHQVSALSHVENEANVRPSETNFISFHDDEKLSNFLNS